MRATCYGAFRSIFLANVRPIGKSFYLLNINSTLRSIMVRPPTPVNHGFGLFSLCLDGGAHYSGGKCHLSKQFGGVRHHHYRALNHYRRCGRRIEIHVRYAFLRGVLPSTPTLPCQCVTVWSFLTAANGVRALFRARHLGYIPLLLIHQSVQSSLAIPSGASTNLAIFHRAK